MASNTPETLSLLSGLGVGRLRSRDLVGAQLSSDRTPTFVDSIVTYQGVSTRVGEGTRHTRREVQNQEFEQCVFSKGGRCKEQ